MLRFIPRDNHPLTEADLAALHPYHGVTARLLYARGVTTAAQADAFLHPSLDQLHDPMLMHGMKEAVDILTQARDEQLPTIVYGDYDVAGICACSLLTLALRRFGIDAQPHTPLRAEGYGLNCDAVRELAGEAGVLVTVELGITNHEEVRLAQRLGMKVIVTDHHGLGLEQSPAAQSILSACKNSVVHSFLRHRLQELHGKEVSSSFDVVLAPVAGISDTDLIIALGNLLDNAVEACMAAQERRIRLTVRQTDAALLRRRAF